ncbi:phosphatase PAP2 family protein [Mesoterricola sediminis]|uniref:Acid phosphatase n=1 Tax=Mesoterricola sediminis TaxID=2927980 RepID=A0AA48GSA5_9BACT|nr:phosphatase PAP2 family protein [Mesoterricola sediminis]BDU78341.1 acid phosphatase [Mesoterricola sediminis]
MTLRSLRFALALALAGPLVLSLPARPAVAAEPDWQALVGPYPAEDSEAAKAEAAILLWLQKTRTRADVARAASTEWLTPDAFADLYPRGAGPNARPRTAALLEAGRVVLRPAVALVKKHYHRQRPFVVLTQLTPTVAKENTGSYPSGHAALAGLYARILAELDPAHRDALLERGALIAHDRVLAGAHWPSDVEAGLKVGEAFAEHWLQENRKQVDAVIAAEWPR